MMYVCIVEGKEAHEQIFTGFKKYTYIPLLNNNNNNNNTTILYKDYGEQKKPRRNESWTIRIGEKKQVEAIRKIDLYQHGNT